MRPESEVEERRKLGKSTKGRCAMKKRARSSMAGAGLIKKGEKVGLVEVDCEPMIQISGDHRRGRRRGTKQCSVSAPGQDAAESNTI